jgi:Mg-chelatase subunit ChlD
LRRSPSLQDAQLKSRARLLALAAMEDLKLDEAGKRLLQLLGVGESAIDNEQTTKTSQEVGEILRSLWKKTSGQLEDSATRGLAGSLKEDMASGVEVVIAVDVSRSMDAGLKGFLEEARWLLPALSWAVPGIRVGAVLYRDDVEVCAGFTPQPAADLLRVLQGARAEGGGDVPEGVHQALKAALSLGRFDWRKDSQKHILVIGDAPPPYREVVGLLGLAAQAHLQGGYKVHALSVRPEEGRSSVAFFPELARAGGGRSVTVDDPHALGAQVFLSLFRSEASPRIERLLPALKQLFLVP